MNKEPCKIVIGEPARLSLRIVYISGTIAKDKRTIDALSRNEFNSWMAGKIINERWRVVWLDKSKWPIIECLCERVKQ